MSLQTHSSERGFHVIRDERLEILLIERDGTITTKGITHQGHLKIQIQECLPLARWIGESKGTTHGQLMIALQPIPPTEAIAVEVPWFLALFPWEDHTCPVVITFESIPKEILIGILTHFPRVTAVLNAGQLLIPNGSEELAKGLRK